MPSLFAHLVAKFATHPENLATEALAYVLNESPAASGAMTQFVRAAANVQQPVEWRTQLSTDEEGTPDIVGVNSSGAPLVIVEAKFWAGLTDHQPVSYLKQLASGEAAVLVVVAPAMRLGSLWNELASRVTKVFEISAPVQHGTEYSAASLAAQHALALCSWRALLNHIAQALSTSGDVAAGADLAQLSALCETMDTSAFLPLRSEELSGSIGARIVQYIELTRNVADQLVLQRIAEEKGPPWTSGVGWAGIWVTLLGWKCVIKFHPENWARNGLTPVWFQVGYANSPPVDIVRSTLRSLGAEPGRLIEKSAGFVDVAIELKTGLDKQEVVADIVDQIGRVRDLIASAQP